MIHLLYLAAGNARRFGSNKLLAPVEGKALYLHGLEMLASLAARRADCTLWVLSRYKPVLDTACALGARAVSCPESEKGLSYTIRTGLDAVGALSAEDFLLFCVADQPWLSAGTVEALLSEARPGTLGATACFGEQLGSPVLFSARLADELSTLQGDEGGRTVWHRHPGQCRRVPVPSERELWDVDHPSQLTGGLAPP